MDEDEQGLRPFTYISLFSGIGGFEEGILQIFPDAQCLGYSEINPSALKVYTGHYPDHPALGDIRKIDGTEFIGKVTLLVGGSPCQNFSAIGDHKGLKGNKSNLFRQYVRLLKKIKPRYFILENVKMSKKHQDQISGILGVEPVCIDSNIVSYQKRRRLYWCNFDISSLATRPFKKGTVNNILLKKGDERLNEVLWKNLKRPRSRLDHKLKEISRGKRGWHVIGMKRTDSHSITLTTEASSHHYLFESPNEARQLHSIELERLQTFPDNWTSVLSKTERSKTLGNAVSCDVIAEIVKQLKYEPISLNRSNRLKMDAFEPKMSTRRSRSKPPKYSHPSRSFMSNISRRKRKGRKIKPRKRSR